MKILVIDIGGTNIKLLASGQRAPIKVPSGPRLTPRQMVDEVLEATEGWSFDAVSIGYPGPVARNRPMKEPVNLGLGWTKFNFQRAFDCPVRMINDAAMQALGSYAGRTMLFLGLGTGLGNTLVLNGVVVPLELAHLPYENGKTYEEMIGEAGLKRLGKRKWRGWWPPERRTGRSRRRWPSPPRRWPRTSSTSSPSWAFPGAPRSPPGRPPIRTHYRYFVRVTSNGP